MNGYTKKKQCVNWKSEFIIIIIIIIIAALWYLYVAIETYQLLHLSNNNKLHFFCHYITV